MNLKLETLNLKLGTLLAALFLSSFIIHHSSFAAESPLYIPFQGQVTNQSGVLTADGQYSVIFNLYDQAVGGQPVWSERHVKIGVTRGMINVFLGSISPLTSVDFSQTKYLGITVDTDNLATTADPEMVPRSLIMPAFHAKNAENSVKLAGFDWTSILVGGSNNPQTGYLNGGKIASESITTNQIGNAQITGAKLAAGAADAAISNEAITSQKIKDGEVNTQDIANGAVTLSKLAPRAPGSAAGSFAAVNISQSMAGNYPSWTAIPTASIDLTVTGRPVLVGLFGGAWSPTNTTSHQDYMGVRIVRENLANGQKTIVRETDAYNVIEVSSGHQHPSRINHPATFIIFDVPAAGSYRYTLERSSFTTYSLSGQFAALEF